MLFSHGTLTATPSSGETVGGVLRQANPEGQPRVTVATAPLEPGVYLVVVRTGAGHRATRRVVKE